MVYNMRYFLQSLLILTVLLTGSNSFAESVLNSTSNTEVQEEPEFLDVHDAFQGIITYKDGVLTTEWEIAEGYYLYRPRFHFSVPDELADKITFQEPQFDHAGKIKHDEMFGEIEVYFHNVTIDVPVQSSYSGPVEFIVKFQGCAEAGLCYPPTKLRETFNVDSNSNAIPNTGTNDSDHSTATTSGSETTSASDSSSAAGIAALLESGGFWGGVALMFVLGIGLTFTPCILPMLPILSSVIVGQKDMNARKGFTLSTTYVLGMAFTYAVAGYVFGVTGEKFQIIMQDPVVLYVFAGVFVLLSLSMFGFYELQLPSGLQNRLNDIGNKQQGGNTIGVFVMGVIAALVASPCISAPLAGALIYISKTGDPLFGATALLAMGIGIGSPLIILGTTGGNIMPKAGAWMNSVKALFGVLLLGVAVYLVKHLLPPALLMLIVATMLIIPAIYMGAMHPVENGWPKLWKGVGIMMMIYGCILLIGLATGGTNPMRPLEKLAVGSGGANTGLSSQTTNQGLTFHRVRDMASLESALADAKQAGQPVMVDYYADWCVACIEMEHDAFQNPQVISALNDHRLIQIDLTNNDDANQLLDRYGLFGPPSILFFNEKGSEQESARVVGEMKAEEFLNHIETQVLSLRQASI